MYSFIVNHHYPSLWIHCPYLWITLSIIMHHISILDKIARSAPYQRFPVCPTIQHTFTYIHTTNSMRKIFKKLPNWPKKFPFVTYSEIHPYKNDILAGTMSCYFTWKSGLFSKLSNPLLLQPLQVGWDWGLLRRGREGCILKITLYYVQKNFSFLKISKQEHVREPQQVGPIFFFLSLSLFHPERCLWIRSPFPGTFYIPESVHLFYGVLF